MISNFLFYQAESGREEHEEYIGMKIEIRDMLKDSLNRKVITEVMMDLKSDLGGDARERVLRLYLDLGLQRDAYQKLESWRWERISRGILELTEMRVEEAYGFIRKHVNSRRSIIRKQAQLATVTLKEEGISYFLDTNRYPISEWQQIKLLEILQQRSDYVPPKFSAWLTSENRDVVLFALRLIRHYRQSDAEPAINSLLNHRKRAIRMAAVECIREFQFDSSRHPLKVLFSRAGEALKLLILDTLAHIGTEEDLPFLEEQAQKDGNFLIRSKARSVMNAIQPNCVLPTLDIDAIPAEEEDAIPFDTGITVSKDTDSEDAAAPLNKGISIPIDGLEEANAIAEIGTGEIMPAETETSLPDIKAFEPAGVPEVSPDEPEPSTAGDRAEDLPESVAPPWEQEEDEALFDLCFMQELEDILSDADPGSRKQQLPPEFLPIVQANTQPMEKPKTNQWLMGLEVDCEILLESPDAFSEQPDEPSGAAPDIPALTSDFLPLVVESATSGEAAEKSPASLRNSPVLREDAAIEEAVSPNFELSETPVDREDTSYFRQNPSREEPTLNCFSIFAEFFREYDTESKLILLDEIPEVGGPKELVFLRSLRKDPDPRLQQKAERAIVHLEKRLGVDAASGSADVIGPQYPDPTRIPEGQQRSLQLSFTPDFTSSGPKKRKAKAQPRTIIDRILGWSQKMTK